MEKIKNYLEQRENDLLQAVELLSDEKLKSLLKGELLIVISLKDYIKELEGN